MRAFSLVPIALLGSLSACATIVSGSTQRIAIDSAPEGASCQVLQGGFPVARIASTPGSVRIEKSHEAVQIDCSKPGYHPAHLTELSGVDGWLFGNLIIGGVVGVVVDFSTGAAYHYSPSTSLALEYQPGSPQVSYSQPYGTYQPAGYASGYAPEADAEMLATQTDAQRFRAATGRSLPADHGVIILPPATPGGDYTTIWPSSHIE
jgi:hypothetical protein